MYYKRDIEVRSLNHCYREKAIIITYSECVCSLSLYSSPNIIHRDGRGLWHVCEQQKCVQKFGGEAWKAEFLEDIGLDGTIILKYSLNK